MNDERYLALWQKGVFLNLFLALFQLIEHANVFPTLGPLCMCGTSSQTWVNGCEHSHSLLWWETSRRPRRHLNSSLSRTFPQLIHQQVFLLLLPKTYLEIICFSPCSAAPQAPSVPAPTLCLPPGCSLPCLPTSNPFSIWQLEGSF